MHRKRVLLGRLLNRERIDFSPKKYFKWLKTCLICILTLAILLNVFILVYFEVTFTLLAVCAANIVLALWIVLYLRRRIKSTSVKGDTLILNSFDQKSVVTSIRSIKNVKTRSFLGISRTQLSYKLDGVTRSAIFFGISSYYPVPPEVSIKKAIALSKKEKNKS
jgi:hypothetical protein